MNAGVEAAKEAKERTHKDVLKQLTLKDPTYTSIEDLLSKYRYACENYIFLDFEAATRDKAEGQLWDTHGKINNRFRAQLAKFREGEGKKKPVERRKLEKHYLDFVKASMRFYRGYIQRLATHFADVPEILQIAQKFNLDTLSADPPIRVNPLLQHLLVQSCHATLIRLGDLSRYRETELLLKERNWGPAKGYYDLATAVDPSSGASYNQLAVIARNDGDHLRAVYYLYRALAVEHPQPLARDNLEKEFKKILNRDMEKTLIPIQDAGRPGSGLQAWFVAFHANCAKGIDSKRRREQEREFLSQLAVDLKERPLDSTLSKLILINIAAEHLARQQDEEGDTDSALTTTYLTFNLKVFFVLLGILVSEFADLEEEAVGDDEAARDNSEKLSAVVRRVLPALRHYSSWLRSSCSSLHRQTDETVVAHVREFWKRYAEALTVLTTTFDIAKLPSVDYLLEEDLDTVAFTPLSTGASADRYREEDQAKPKIGDTGVQRLDNSQEMMARVRGLVLDGIRIVAGDEQNSQRIVPIDLGETRFEYHEAHLIAEPFHDPHGQISHSHNQSAASVTREDIEQAKRQSIQMPPPGGIQEDVSETASASVSTAMHHMIDGLVDSEISDDPLPILHLTPLSPGQSLPMSAQGSVDVSNETSFGKAHHQHSTLTAQDLVNQMLRSQNVSKPTSAPNIQMRPQIASFYETSFATMASETNSPKTRPTTAHKVQPDSSTPVPLSSESAFQQDILKRQQQLQMHSTPVHPPLSTSSWSYQESPVGKQFPPLQSPPWTQSPSLGFQSPYSHADEVPRKAPAPAIFGAIGQTPPSAQAG